MIRILFVVAVVLGVRLSYAQDVKAVLVQLSSEQNRISYLQKKGANKDIKEIVKEANKVNKATILDFKDHFNACPVYFYMDTNSNLVKNKHFEGVLLDSIGIPAKNGVISSSDDNYVIVYYGYSATDNTTASDHAGLVILNDRFRQIYFLFGIRSFGLSIDDAVERKYSYNSPKYDIEYRPFATRLNAEMDNVVNKMEKHRKRDKGY